MKFTKFVLMHCETSGGHNSWKYLCS